VTGRSWSTEELASHLENWRLDARNVNLMVGGPEGLAAEVAERSEQRWSLSALTLPHPLVRILLAEQLYRAWTILNRHPYHK
jgi:23S rRNA (pseudouridine1915-N3)-methyltransferase